MYVKLSVVVISCVHISVDGEVGRYPWAEGMKRGLGPVDTEPP